MNVRNRRPRLIVVAIIVSLASFAAPAVSTADPVDDALTIVDGLIRPLTQLLGIFESERPSVEGLPDPVNDSTQPAARIEAALARTNTLLAARPDLAALIEPVREATVAARSEYFGGETSIDRVMGLITDAVGEAQAVTAPDQETADAMNEVSTHLTAASERIARSWIDIARTAGVDSQIVDAAQASVDAGVGAVASGDHEGGADHFDDAYDQVAPSVKWDIDRFYDRLVARFADQTTGLQFSLSSGGQYYDDHESGLRRMPQEDEFQLPMTSHSDLLVASVSKVITATAALQLLEERGLSPDDPIAPWLPKHWETGTDIGELTFADLLQHRSGFNKNSFCCPGWKDLRDYIALGTIYDPDPLDPSRTRYVYLNLNYSLLATLIGRLNPSGEYFLKSLEEDIEALGAGYGEPGDIAYHDIAAYGYMEWVNDNILKPSGIADGGSCSQDVPWQPLYYDFSDPTAKGVPIAITGVNCGYGGWQLSTQDLLAFMDELKYGGLLTNQDRAQMWQDFYGWAPPPPISGWTWVNGASGVYHSHGGDFGLPKGMDACIMSFPNGTQVALNMNSVNGDYAGSDPIPNYQCDGITFDFDNSWVKL